MNRKLTEHELLDRLARLPREIRPPRDPWLEISARLDEPVAATAAYGEAAAPGWLSRAIAAVAVAAVAAGIVFSEPQPAGPAPVLRQAAAPSMIAASEAEYRAAIREFIPLGEARDALPLATVERIEDSWSALQRTEEALRAALAADPDNRFLNQRMLELRSRQLGFLRQLASLDHSNRRMST